jgi:transcriptional regulator with XRE-family HTH domain
MTESPTSWLIHGSTTATSDDAGAVLRAWRTTSGRSQVEVAAALGLTQQNLSQLENGRRPMSIELRRRIVEELGIAAEDLGLSSGQAPHLVSPDDASPHIAASRMRWRAERRWLNRHRADLARLATQLYPAQRRVGRTPLIADPDWLPPVPVDLGSLRLELDEGPQTVQVDGSEPQTERVRPLRSNNRRFERYTSAIRHLSPPRLFDSRPSYRLLDAAVGASRLKFGLGAYFDKLDVCEALSHELAAACMAFGPDVVPAQLAGRLPFRDLIGNPFDCNRRPIIPGVATLTIRLRRYPAEPTVLLHWRDPAKVANTAGIYHVIPAGEFQPSSVALWDRHNDFDLWRNIVREYSEELLGVPEHDGSRSQPIDYDAWPLYRDLQQARTDGELAVFFLGMGACPLILSTSMLTVAVISDDVFTSLFGSMVRVNEEGELVAVGDGAPADGVPFTESTVTRLLTSEPITSSGAACLALAWQHRARLGL